MTALNKQALNPAELESALLELKRISEQPAVSTHYARVLRKHIANLNCALGAAEKRIAEQREYYEGVIADGNRRIAELEARNVTLPDVEKWRSVDAVRAQSAYKVLVSKVLAAAGIGVKGE